MDRGKGRPSLGFKMYCVETVIVDRGISGETFAV